VRLKQRLGDSRTFGTPASRRSSGGFLHTDVAPKLWRGPRVLYLGDYDLSGGQIEDNTRRALEREVGSLKWERVALSEQQVADYELPVITKKDRRYKDGRPHQAVETEAISQRADRDPARSTGASAPRATATRTRTRDETIDTSNLTVYDRRVVPASLTGTVPQGK
jgi:hypothetical protein